MKRHIVKYLLFGVMAFFGIGAACIEGVFAESVSAGATISLTPVSNILQISSNSVYDATMTVKNEGESPIKIEVYAAPYSYVYDGESDLYKLGFNNENNFTQMTRWISFKDSSGNYVASPVFTIEPQSTLDVEYRISTPDNIPSGGQYAVIFARTVSSAATNGIRTEASPGMVVWGRSTEGEIDLSAEISNMSIEQKALEDGKTGKRFFASAKVKNTGNVDFAAKGTMKVEPIIGFSSYDTSANVGMLSIIPESELTVSDEWEDSPSFGVYKVSWTVTAGELSETIDKIVFIISPLVIIITIIVLTILIIWITIMVRRRRERRSRLAV